MDRRRFLELSALASALLLSRDLLAQAQEEQPRTAPSERELRVPADFTGLSYESRQLGDPNFFAASNKQLVALVSLLGKEGVLRIGGNTSEYCFFDRNATHAAQQPIVADPDKGHTAPPLTTITPAAIRNLRGFLHATNWKLVYGLNFGNGTPESAADEAAFVSETIGDRLIAFQIGNEPDLFPQNGLRPKGWTLDQFLSEWQQFAQAVRKRVPRARFWGPANAGHIEWTSAFAQRFHDQIATISEHYYAEGPPTDPSMTIDRLLHPNPRFEKALGDLEALSREVGIPIRISETNSCYSGGKEGVSNTFASALWGADLMFELATAGASGINFHGGGNGWYTPIAGSLASGFSARPIYYGMLLFAEALKHGGEIETHGLFDNPLIGGYRVKTRRRETIAIINKQSDAPVLYEAYRYNRKRWKSAEVLALTAASLDATTGVTFGGSAVKVEDGRAVWRPEPQTVRASDGKLKFVFAPASAALIMLRS